MPFSHISLVSVICSFVDNVVFSFTFYLRFTICSGRKALGRDPQITISTTAGRLNGMVTTTMETTTEIVATLQAVVDQIMILTFNCILVLYKHKILKMLSHRHTHSLF